MVVIVLVLAISCDTDTVRGNLTKNMHHFYSEFQSKTYIVITKHLHCLTWGYKTYQFYI